MSDSGPDDGSQANAQQDDNAENREDSDDSDAITWTASEFIAHQKSAAWYGKLAGVTVATATVTYLITRDPISTSAIVICALLFGVIAARQPRQLEYRLDNQGLQIGQKHLDYEAFRSFSVVPEGAFPSVILLPLRRFSPLTTIYFAPEDQDRIVDMLAGWLPFEEYQHDAVDRLMHRIRF